MHYTYVVQDISVENSKAQVQTSYLQLAFRGMLAICDKMSLIKSSSLAVSYTAIILIVLLQENGYLSFVWVISVIQEAGDFPAERM